MTLKARAIDRQGDLDIWAYSAPGIECVNFVGTKMARYIDVVGSMEIWAHAPECCDVTTPDNEKVSTCFLPGLTKNIVANIYEFENCESAQCLQCGLSYDAGSGTWKGSFSLRSGTLNLEMACVPTGDPDNPDFTLTFTGDCTDGPYGPVTHLLLFSCDDPWARNLDQINVNTCCGCSLEDTSDISMVLIGNCRPYKLARLIDVREDPSHNMREIYGYGEQCVPWNSNCEENTCAHIHCLLTVEIIADGTCAALAGTYAFHWNATGAGTGFWSVVGDIPGPGTILTMTCDGNGDLHIDFVCGVTNVGSGDGHTDDPENIDETISVTLTDSATTDDCGFCLFHWDDMAHSWIQDEDHCSGVCSGCVEPVGVGAFDGQPATTVCGVNPAPSCCIGTIQVRVTR